jgi:hypothetical protein
MGRKNTTYSVLLLHYPWVDIREKHSLSSASRPSPPTSAFQHINPVPWHFVTGLWYPYSGTEPEKALAFFHSVAGLTGSRAVLHITGQRFSPDFTRLTPLS